MWKVYKSKVLKTLNPEYEEDTAEEVHFSIFAPLTDSYANIKVSERKLTC